MCGACARAAGRLLACFVRPLSRRPSSANSRSRSSRTHRCTPRTGRHRTVILFAPTRDLQAKPMSPDIPAPGHSDQSAQETVSPALVPGTAALPPVGSLLDLMVDGREYQSILDAQVQFDAVTEVKRALREIEQVRGRPCIAYVGNVVSAGLPGSEIGPADDVPFAELVASIPADETRVDVLLASNGGSGQQVGRFVDALRPRFQEVDFLIPSFCMSAGTMFALSGDNIWMTSRACLGPIDPQVPTAGGRFVPAQALLLLVEKLQRDGEVAIKTGGMIPWTAVRIVDTIDKKELGEAITASDYSRRMVQEFLVRYKFGHWDVRKTSGARVDEEYKRTRAAEIADALCSHERWKSHGHAINREVLLSEIKLKIEHPDGALLRSITRAWALFNWVFEKSPIQKFVIGANYAIIRFAQVQQQQATP